MKKIALAAAALALSAGAAFAENPTVGTPADLYANDSTPAAAQKVDYAAPASISKSTVDQTNPAANRFGDASPANQQ
ncbi:hypothetical protein DUT91_04845 [Phyllobacterium salinisoli]|uniref:DUF680 domain-containing protein n=1 Tax=Phyllobacterium salinisoli TaxID=1899321 RepID=A0A368K6F5_9HYPH|nr:hypothetical protein [Phyllobacterium salinisoli]RCS24794.1 hypothetical protein DUT91_04845 [Phyllobacterium salinisoli]